MQPMKTRTVQDVPKPAFSDWWCYIHGITPTSPLVAKLEAMNIFRALGVDIPAFIKKNIIEVPKTGGTLSVKAITNSPNVKEFVWSENPDELTLQIRFKNGEAVSVTENKNRIKSDIEKTRRVVPSNETELHELMRVRLLRSLFRIPGFLEKL